MVSWHRGSLIFFTTLIRRTTLGYNLGMNQDLPIPRAFSFDAILHLHGPDAVRVKNYMWEISCANAQSGEIMKTKL